MARKTDDEVNRELMDTGWFSQLDGPEGQFPAQAFGTLMSGEDVYFRARGTRAALEVTPTEGQGPRRRYEKVLGSGRDAAELDSEDWAKMMRKWLTLYFEEIAEQS